MVEISLTLRCFLTSESLVKLHQLHVSKKLESTNFKSHSKIASSLVTEQSLDSRFPECWFFVHSAPQQWGILDQKWKEMKA